MGRRSVAFVAVLAMALPLASCTQSPQGQPGPSPANLTAARPHVQQPALRTWSAPITSSRGDVEQRPNGRVTLRSGALELTRDRVRQQIGLRFGGVRVPRRAVVRRAWIQFSADGVATRRTHLRIGVQGSANPPRFRATTNNVGTRARLRGSVRWTPRGWEEPGARRARQRTPNLRPLVQQIVDRRGWRSGNAVVFLFSGWGKRVATSYDGRGRPPTLHISYAPPPPTRFTFAAAGDIGAERNTAASLRVLDRSDASFFLALGDLRYGALASDGAWCDYVLDRLPRKGRRFPIELVVGNHEQDGSGDGDIRNFARCMPDRLGARVPTVGRYAAEYAIDYPRLRPLARFLMIAPNLTVAGRRYTYQPGSPHRAWLVRQIDRARAAGIRWVIVGMHYPCITVGEHGCDSGEEILNLLVRKRVDLVLTGHNHIYERSRQLRINDSTCPALREEAPDLDCVVDSGADDRYVRGAGTVQVTAGSFGHALQEIDELDADLPYFASTDEDTFGLMTYVVDRNRLRATFHPSGGTRFTDSFDIAAR